jgi:hypothetical protein
MAIPKVASYVMLQHESAAATSAVQEVAQDVAAPVAAVGATAVSTAHHAVEALPSAGDQLNNLRRIAGGAAIVTGAGGALGMSPLPGLVGSAAAAATDPANCAGKVTDTLAKFKVTKAALAKRIGVPAGSVASEIKSMCAAGVAIPQIGAAIMVEAAYTVSEIGTILKDAFLQDATAAAGILQAVGFDASEIATALLGVYELLAAEAAALLKALSFTASQVGQALVDDYHLLAEAVAQILKDVLFLVSEIGQALVDVFNLLAEGAATIL